MMLRQRPGASRGAPLGSLRNQLLRWLLAPLVLLVAVNSISAYTNALEVADVAYDRALLASTRALAERVSVKEGKVVLNIAERAVVRLQIDNASVSFSARFGGVSYPVMVPISAVLAIYARETGQGMALPDDIAGATGPEDDDEPPTPSDDPPSSAKRPSFLRVVK